jgi:geranylgeranyl diphosphate synthase type II
MEYKESFTRYSRRVEEGLRRFLPATDTRPARIHEAMRYSLESGGKRLRPILLLAAADLFAGDRKRPDALPAAIAIECVHTYSLIHDDLPCMDDDDLRRGRPTVHRAYDEATAVLAGDALLTHAFALIAESYASESVLGIELVRELSRAAGSTRLIGGQMEDLMAEQEGRATADQLELIHANKTAAMIEASLAMGARIGGADDSSREFLRSAGHDLGVAFQIVDDILDATGSTASLGKTAGKDARDGKATFVGLHGIDRSRSIAESRTSAAMATIRGLPGDTEFLAEIAHRMARRDA